MPFALLPQALFASPERNLRIAKLACRISYGTLIISLLADGLIADTQVILLIFAITPLLIFLPGLIREDHRSMVLLCFVALLYFTVVVTNLFEPDKSGFGIVALVSVVALFITAMMYSRWLRAAERLNQSAENKSDHLSRGE